ncbi:unnamed protein product [Caenorhabditis brenneri]
MPVINSRKRTNDLIGATYINGVRVLPDNTHCVTLRIVKHAHHSEVTVVSNNNPENEEVGCLMKPFIIPPEPEYIEYTDEDFAFSSGEEREESVYEDDVEEDSDTEEMPKAPTLDEVRDEVRKQRHDHYEKRRAEEIAYYKAREERSQEEKDAEEQAVLKELEEIQAFFAAQREKMDKELADIKPEPMQEDELVPRGSNKTITMTIENEVKPRKGFFFREHWIEGELSDSEDDDDWE